MMGCFVFVYSIDDLTLSLYPPVDSSAVDENVSAHRSFHNHTTAPDVCGMCSGELTCNDSLPCFSSCFILGVSVNLSCVISLSVALDKMIKCRCSAFHETIPKSFRAHVWTHPRLTDTVKSSDTPLFC